MGKEIERKFLLDPEFCQKNFEDNSYTYCQLIEQGYFNHRNPCTRIRICTHQDRSQSAFLTFKSKDNGIEDFEFEYEISVCDAREMVSLYCGKRIITKTRYYLECNGFTWSVDFFHNCQGLVIVEVELEHQDQEVSLPEWVGQEVTDQSQYKNYFLALKNEEEWKK